MWPRRLDRSALDACAAALVGHHNFRAFTPTETQHQVFARRVLSAAWSDVDDELVFDIEADSYLRHMVRSLVGTMVDCAAGTFSVAWFEQLLRGESREQAGRTAPPHGLCLLGAHYRSETENSGNSQLRRDTLQA